MVEMAFTNVFTTRADSVTGEFVYKRVKLMPGKNLFTFRASDKAGNVSAPTEYTLNLAPKNHSRLNGYNGSDEIQPNENYPLLLPSRTPARIIRFKIWSLRHPSRTVRGRLFSRMKNRYLVFSGPNCGTGGDLEHIRKS